MADRLRRSARRVLSGALVGVVLAAGATSSAHADPAEPTDYRSEVVAVDPPTPTIHADIVGGDSFFQLTVEPGTEVFVVGYQGEDYLWFRADGVVFENRRSPATYLNEDRYGVDIPPQADADADPDWAEVADGGTWVWHDHRAHWMQQSRPAGASAGDQILEATIPTVVDGVDVDVRVISTWEPSPSPVPAWLGAVAGAFTVAGAWLLRRRGRPSVASAVPAAMLATLVGAWQYWSLPAATGPRLVWVLLPAVAAVCALVGVVLGRNGSTFPPDAASLIVGVELAVWGWVKRDGLGAAIIPTDAPMWLDRFATTLALVGGVALAASALWWLFVATGVPGADPISDSREPTGSPRPARP